MAEKVTVLIVDDEDLARAKIRTLLGGFADVECVGEAANGLEAVELIRKRAPDVVILDIQMPGMDGFQVIDSLEEVPLIIFATAYNEYAIKAFEVNSVDYLLKPITKERFSEALERARQLLAGGPDLDRQAERIARLVQSKGVERLPVMKGKRIILLDVDAIVWVGVRDELVFVHTRDARFLVNMTMAELEKRLAPGTFFRIHRSSIVNLNRVLEIVPWFAGKYKVIVADEDRTELVLSRARAKSLREILPW